MDVMIYSFNLDISPKRSCDVLECDSYAIELHAYDFVMKDFVIKEGCYLCRTLYIIVWRRISYSVYIMELGAA